MNSRSFIVFVCLVVAAAAFVFSTIDQLPETVATHYGAGGRANGWMTRSGYLLFMMVFLLGFSTLVSFLIGFIPHKLPRLTNIPNRGYWLAEERREGSLQFLSSHGWWLGCLIVFLSGSMHMRSSKLIIANHRRCRSRFFYRHQVDSYSACLFGSLCFTGGFRKGSKCFDYSSGSSNRRGGDRKSAG